MLRMWGWREAGMLDELTDDYCEWRRSEEEERWGGSDHLGLMLRLLGFILNILEIWGRG